MKAIKSHFTEFIAVLGGLFALVFGFSFFPINEAHTDVLWYLNMGFNNIQDPHWLTRYTHVFLQKIFVFFYEDPFIALKAYWIFLMVLSSGLIYLLTRLLSNKSNFITGGLSVLFFLSFHLHGLNFGVAWADLTSMLIVLLTLLIFVLYIKNKPNNRWLYLLGAFFFIAFKTKETAWVVMFLVFPLGLDDENRVDFKLFFQRLKYVLIGTGIGVLIFMLLNWVLLEDAFFDFRIENLKTYLSFWIVDSDYHKSPTDWYRNDVFLFFPLVFLLYFYKGTRLDNIESKTVWLYPILLISFLTFGMVKNTYTVYPRFLYPAFAVTSIFAALALEFEYPRERKKQFKFWAWLISGLVIYQIIHKILIYYTISSGISFDQFITSAFQPLLLSGIILCLVFIKKLNYQTVILPLILVFAFVRPNLIENYRQALSQPHDGIMQNRFYPLEIFGDKITLSEDMVVYISTNVPDQFGYFSKNKDTIRTVFDLHFLATTQRENFTIKPGIDTIYNAVLEHTYTYLFLTTDDWDAITALPESENKILNLCTLSQDNNQNLVFLDCR